MQVFIIGTPFETASILDKRRLNKQIIECKQILQALSGESKAWSNHPAIIQYRSHQMWLIDYMKCLVAYQEGNMFSAQMFSAACEHIKPFWHCQDYFDQMKRRLYTKDPVFYADFAEFGTSEVNWYFVNNQWKEYMNGKMIGVRDFT